MTDRYYDPFPPLQDANGNPYSGALLYFYEAGTATPLATYSDAALTVANTNPIVCNSSGRPAVDIFYANAAYRVVAKTSAGATIWTADPINAVAAPASAGFRNLIINGNFNVNQRGYVSAAATGTANQYTLDRWRVVTSGQNLTFAASGNGNLVTAPAGGVEQVVEGANVLGGTYVLNWIGTATATVAGTPRAKGEAFTIAANTDTTVQFANGTASQVQLELGDVITAFESRHIGAELLLCQRYFFQSTGAQQFSANATGGGFGGFMRVNFPATMRAVPTVTTTSSGGVNIGAPGTANISTNGWDYTVTSVAGGTMAATLNTGNAATAEL